MDKRPPNWLDDLIAFLQLSVVVCVLMMPVIMLRDYGRSLTYEPQFWCRSSIEADRLSIWAPSLYATYCNEYGIYRTVYSEIGMRAGYGAWIVPEYYGLEPL